MKIHVTFEVEVPVHRSQYAKVQRALTEHSRQEAEAFVQRCLAKAFEADNPAYWRAAKAQGARRGLRVVDPE